MWLIFLFCLLGCGTHCWYAGRRVGIQGAIDHLTEEGYLDFND